MYITASNNITSVQLWNPRVMSPCCPAVSPSCVNLDRAVAAAVTEVPSTGVPSTGVPSVSARRLIIWHLVAELPCYGCRQHLNAVSVTLSRPCIWNSNSEFESCERSIQPSQENNICVAAEHLIFCNDCNDSGLTFEFFCTFSLIHGHLSRVHFWFDTMELHPLVWRSLTFSFSLTVRSPAALMTRREGVSCSSSPGGVEGL